jgi:hypothetical protein
MTPQEQAQAVADAAARARCLHQWSTVNDPPCHPSDEGWTGCHLCVSHSTAGDVAAIRAAVDLVLPEERRLCDRSYQRMIKRAQFLAIAAELEGPTDD